MERQFVRLKSVEHVSNMLIIVLMIYKYYVYYAPETVVGADVMSVPHSWH